jgi:hypothetical protein
VSLSHARLSLFSGISVLLEFPLRTQQARVIADFAHLDMAESLGNPYGPNGRAALALMKL